MKAMSMAIFFAAVDWMILHYAIDMIGAWILALILVQTFIMIAIVDESER